MILEIILYTMVGFVCFMAFKALYNITTTFYYHKKYMKLSDKLNTWMYDNMDTMSKEEMQTIMDFYKNEVGISMFKDTKPKEDYLELKKRVEDNLPFIGFVKKGIRKRKLDNLGV
jgi:hypothetical protein